LRNDREVVIAAAMNYAPSLRYAPESLRYDKEIIDYVIGLKND
jgi:hypothetical protein